MCKPCRSVWEGWHFVAGKLGVVYDAVEADVVVVARVPASPMLALEAFM